MRMSPGLAPVGIGTCWTRASFGHSFSCYNYHQLILTPFLTIFSPIKAESFCWHLYWNRHLKRTRFSIVVWDWWSLKQMWQWSKSGLAFQCWPAARVYSEICSWRMVSKCNSYSITNPLISGASQATSHHRFFSPEDRCSRTFKPENFPAATFNSRLS